MNIQATYVTYEQAKLLKEKGFNVECLYYYGITNSYLSIGSDIPAKNWNEKIEDHMDEVELYSRPEQWQVVEWLRVNHGIWINVMLSRKEKQYTFFMESLNFDADKLTLEYFNTPQEAYSVAFDYILKELI